jgi:hypothetical protein
VEPSTLMAVSNGILVIGGAGEEGARPDVRLIWQELDG